MMQLSEAGRIAEQEWLRTAELRPYVDLDTHIVMPNHIHGLIIIRGTVIQHNVSDRSRRHSLPASSAASRQPQVAASQRYQSTINGLSGNAAITSV
jgi:hypothetical protein